MNQSNNTADKASKLKNSKFETKASFALALITLFLIFGYFWQSFTHIQQQEIIVIAIERIESKVDAKKEQE
ncbi:hypothetical protein L4D76_22930 [Photobacterium sagamiensis]|uniref:hypothetical protein n=1 Tax=Photobacterium sagamiensis TaxID=2910241 RepID=UPI003D095BC8